MTLKLQHYFQFTNTDANERQDASIRRLLTTYNFGIDNRSDINDEKYLNTKGVKILGYALLLAQRPSNKDQI